MKLAIKILNDKLLKAEKANNRKDHLKENYEKEIRELK